MTELEKKKIKWCKNNGVVDVSLEELMTAIKDTKN